MEHELLQLALHIFILFHQLSAAPRLQCLRVLLRLFLAPKAESLLAARCLEGGLRLASIFDEHREVRAALN